jgi:hypothetical protein
MSQRRTSSSRSDEVRVRREREQVKREKQATERAYRPRAARKKTPRQQAERRYNIAVGLPQSRLRVPSLPRIKPGWRMASLALSLALGVALYLLWNLPYFRVIEAQVTGAARLPSAEINAALGVSGQPIFGLQSDELETRLRLNYPELSSAQVTISLPNQIAIQVTERQPVLLWQQGDGYTWIDSTGVAFHPRGEVSGLILVISLATPPAGLSVTDDPFSPLPYLSADLVKSAQTLAAILPPGASMIYDARNGFGWSDPQGWQVFFGTSSKDMALKVRVYQSLAASLAARGIYPAFISVVQVDAPYYRMAQ